VLTRDLLRGPQPAGRLQDPGLLAVRQQEGAVVAEGLRGLRGLPALAPLAVELQQAGDHRQRCPGAGAALQTQPGDGESKE